MSNEEKAEQLFQVLKPCLKRTRKPGWATLRYVTAWGSKTEDGLKKLIARILNNEKPPESSDEA